MSDLPDLRGLWEGPWPYSCSEGVGLQLVGLPSDIFAFEFLLNQHSCHPKAVARILTRLRQNGFDKLTVMVGLKFHEIQLGLDKLGVRMTIIPPQPGWTANFEDGSWPKDALERIGK